MATPYDIPLPSNAWSKESKKPTATPAPVARAAPRPTAKPAPAPAGGTLTRKAPAAPAARPAPAAPAARPAPVGNQFESAMPTFSEGGRAALPGMWQTQGEGREGQLQLSNLLYQRALGGGPSAAETMLQGQRQQAMREQMQAGAVGGAAGLRQGQLGAAETEQRLGQTIGTLRAQEQIQSQEQLAGVLTSLRSGDATASSLAGQLLEQGAARDIDEARNIANALVEMASGELDAAKLANLAESTTASNILGVQTGNRAMSFETQRNFIDQFLSKAGLQLTGAGQLGETVAQDKRSQEASEAARLATLLSFVA